MESTLRHIAKLLDAFPSITLEEMSAVGLMNRTDRKFVTTEQHLPALLALLGDSHLVQETCRHRIIPYATTYWDDPAGHPLFRAHLCGHRPRLKVRVRTYLDTHTSFLELKRKDNHGRTVKSRTPLTATAGPAFRATVLAFLQPTCGAAATRLRPVLNVGFSRITFVNAARTERLTVDIGLHFHNEENGIEVPLPGMVVIEIKSNGRRASDALPLLRRLRIKPAAFSKYGTGLSLTAPQLPHNRFKPRLHRLDRLSQPAIATPPTRR